MVYIKLNSKFSIGVIIVLVFVAVSLLITSTSSADKYEKGRIDSSLYLISGEHNVGSTHNSIVMVDDNNEEYNCDYNLHNEPDKKIELIYYDN